MVSLFRKKGTPVSTEKGIDPKNVIITVGTFAHCAVCGQRNEVTMSYTQDDIGDDALATRYFRFHCSSCGSNVEFRILWDWDIDKLYR